ncbi:Oidioi.mRNA.OKI2018_I69.PAR.g12759.t1.cds [Oikopleura dioica]|uniref:Oidioi.mRNA.OKI2018_I69.PAR.g12759.t1.cds n=1 Tax=Oikopleura dioica TaxID=34765 RepID=A0ABN7S1K2_OIKDI|nr:Oidioi.mRNA.OKI2018_I69.PAR.g12759.t1.cds [Oikopleura dioica]
MGFDARIDESRDKIGEKLKRRITCPVCTFILEDPVSLFCCGGHVCSECYEDVSTCPRCRKANFKAIKGRLMMDVLSTIKLICPNSACRTSLLYDNFQEHKKNCFALRDERCPECDRAISMSKFHLHFKCFQKMAEDKKALMDECLSKRYWMKFTKALEP